MVTKQKREKDEKVSSKIKNGQKATKKEDFPQPHQIGVFYDRVTVQKKPYYGDCYNTSVKITTQVK